MRQYQLVYQQMLSEKKEMFDAFKEIHTLYILDPKVHQQTFNQIGKEIVDIIRDYERRLCATSEKGGYGKYSLNLSQKFWDVIRKDFSKIDFVGVQ